MAYQVFGDGPVDLVWAGSFASHVELFWTMPEFVSLMESLGSFARILLFDKAGVGLSDPVARIRTLDERATEIDAVMDAAGFGRSAILGVSEGGPAAALFAATRPHRTRALILTGASPRAGMRRWEDADSDPADLRARIAEDLGEKYAPSLEWIARAQGFFRAARSSWGSGEALKSVISGTQSIRQLGMLERSCASPGMARATAEAGFQIDVRPILPTIAVPTLILHAREDPAVPVQSGRYFADHIRGARMVELEGSDHAPWLTEPDRVIAEIEELLTGKHAAYSPPHRALRAVLFTDIVSSTQHATALGDGRWRHVLTRFGQITAESARRFGGMVLKSTGDGHLMTFTGPTEAIRCAVALADEARTIGVEIRAGVHVGECELLADDIGGIAVHIAARILGQAGPGEVLVSRTVRDLVVGSGTGFSDRGTVELRGVTGAWQLLAVDRHGPSPGSAEAGLMSMATPGPRSAMRRTDRAAGVVAKRMPWMLRALARLNAPTH